MSVPATSSTSLFLLGGCGGASPTQSWGRGGWHWQSRASWWDLVMWLLLFLWPINFRNFVRPLLVALGAGERCSSPCSFSHTVQVKPCVASINVTALSLKGEVGGIELKRIMARGRWGGEGEGGRENKREKGEGRRRVIQLELCRAHTPCTHCTICRFTFVCVVKNIVNLRKIRGPDDVS